MNMSNDPELYTKFNDRLMAILEKYSGNWDVIIDELDSLRNEMKSENRETAEGLDEIEDVFYRNLINNAFTKNTEATGDGVSEPAAPYVAQESEVKNLVIDIVELLRHKLEIPNFWKRAAEVKKLQGEIDDKLDFCGIPEIDSKHEKICTDILSLAEKRENDLIRRED